MNAFTVDVDTANCLVTITLQGFWDDVTFDTFSAAFVKAFGELRAANGCKYALVDGRNFAVQSAEITLRFQELITSMAPLAAQRTATIVPAQLNRLQAARTGGAIYNRLFTDPVAAKEWLFSDRD
jgi:hypothetical protein